MEKIVVISGATGKQGGAVARFLAGQGFHIKAMTRKPHGDAVHALRQLGAEIVQGDLDDAESLKHVLQGAWGAFAVQNTWEAGVERERLVVQRTGEGPEQRAPGEGGRPDLASDCSGQQRAALHAP